MGEESTWQCTSAMWNVFVFVGGSGVNDTNAVPVCELLLLCVVTLSNDEVF